MTDLNATPAEIRTAHIGHEASIRGVALLYYFASVFLCLGGLVVIFVPASNASGLKIMGSVFVGLGGLYAVLAWGIRRFKRWTRIPATVLACIGLAGFPLGTLINGYILYLLHSGKGKTIFSPEYQQIVAKTPEARYKTPVILWILLILVISLFLIVIAVAALSADWKARASQDQTPQLIVSHPYCTGIPQTCV